MYEKNALKSVVGSLALVAVLAGCAAAPPPEKPAEEVLKDGLTNLADVTAYSYDLSLKGDLTDPAGEKLNFDVKLDGALDSTDPMDPRVVLKLDGTASDSTGMGGSAKGELRMDKESLYFNVMNLDVEGEELPTEFTELFNKWWMMPIPPGTFDELDVTLSSADEEQKAELKKNLQDISLFATPEFVGTDNVMGEASHHYKVNIDKEGLLKFTKAAAEAEGEVVTDAEFAEARAELEKVDISGDVWVGSESGVVNKFEGTINMKGGAGEPSGTINISLSIGNINKAVTVEAPADAEEFPAEQIFGAMMMMGGGLPATDDSMMMDDSMTDDSMMMTDPSMMTDEELNAMMEDAMMESGMTEEELDAMLDSMPAMQQ